METSTNTSAEIIIVGAGMAGTVAAAVLGQQGRRVILVDPRPIYPHVFKAEKIAQCPVDLLRKFGLLGYLLPYSRRLREVRTAFDGRIFRTIPIEQYGIDYSDMVNALRAHLPPFVDYRLGRVDQITNCGGVQRVKLAGSEELTSRLVVLASGVSRGIQTNLRLRRRVVQRDQSLVFGFTLAAPESQTFDFDSVTYYSLDPSARIDYLTLFKFRQTMRANLFVFRSASDPWVRDFILEPDRMLRRYLPKLDRVIGEFRVVSKVESGREDLYRMDGDPPPGVALVGDAFQSVCPATGMGVEKILTDVDVLSECVPHWFATPGMGTDKLAKFYNHPVKLATDLRALRRAHFQRLAATDTSLRWRIYRFLLQFKRRLLSGIRSFTAQSSNVPEAGTGNPRKSGLPFKIAL